MVLKYINGIDDLKGDNKEPEITFNYLGQQIGVKEGNKLLVPIPGPMGDSVDGGNERKVALEITGEVVDGELILVWNYEEGVHNASTIKQLGESYLEELRGIVKHCVEERNYGYTESDFPLSGLDRRSLRESFGFIRDIEEIYPLSPMQSGLLFQHLYDRESDTYFVQGVYEIRGELDLDCFKEAWEALLRQHGVLRTGYSWEGLEEPLQYVMRGVSLPYEFIDWEGEKEVEHLLEELLLEDRKSGFDLRKAPLLRIKVIRVEAERYYMLWSNHHIILDGWCTSLLLGDLLELYEGLKEGRGVRLRYREPYSKYIGWLGEQKQEEAEKFWKNYLQDLEGGGLILLLL